MAGGGEGFTIVLKSFTNHGELMVTQYQQIWCGVNFFSITVWHLSFRRNLNDWDVEGFCNLLQMLDPFQIIQN